MPERLALSFLEGLPLTQRALEFALEHHRGQRRPGDGALFILHPLEVAFLVDRSGYPDTVVAAAVLHDVIENTDADRIDLRDRFGGEVSNLVAAVSDDPTIVDEERRKAELTERIAAFDGDAAVVYAADKISKVRELRTLMTTGIDAQEAAAKRDRHWDSLAMLERTIPESRLVGILRFELEVLAELPPEGPPSLGGSDP